MIGKMMGESTNHDRRHVYILIALTIAALYLRLHDLGAQSLWWDEANTYRAMNGSPAQVWTALSSDVIALPLDSFLLSLCAEGSPPNEFLFRFPAALFGVLTVPLIYIFARDHWGRRAGLIAAALIAFSPYHIRYSQEARYYASFAALHLASLVMLWRALRRPSARRWIAYAVSAAVMCYDLAFGFLALGLQTGLHALATFWQLLARRFRTSESSSSMATWRTLRSHAWSIGGMLLLLLPWVIAVWASGKTSSALYNEVGTLRGYSDLVVDGKNYLGMFRWFTTNSDASSPLFFRFCALIVLVVLAGRGRGRRSAWLTLTYSVVFTTLLVLISHTMYIWPAYRRFMFLQPLLFALVAAGVDRGITLLEYLPQGGRIGWIFLFLFLLRVTAVWGPAIGSYYASEKEDWRELSQILQQEATPNDLIINFAMGYQSERALVAYLGPDNGRLQVISPTDVIDFDRDMPLAGDARIWMIYPVPLEIEDATHRTLNDITRLRALDIPVRPDSPAFQAILSLEGPLPAPSGADALADMALNRLEWVAVTDTPIFSGWRSNVLNALLTAYEARGETDRVGDIYMQATEFPGMPANVRGNMSAIADYLAQRQAAGAGVIFGDYLSDPGARAALVDALKVRGYAVDDPGNQNMLAQITAQVYADWVAAGQTGSIIPDRFDAVSWLAGWDASAVAGELSVAKTPAVGAISSCLKIETTGFGYHGAIRREIPVEPGELYLLGVVTQRSSQMSLQGKALHVEYGAGRDRQTVYASAWWGGTEEPESIIALFAAPAGVDHIMLSPVLIDNAGETCILSVFAVPIP